jgi:hypothetical protein
MYSVNRPQECTEHREMSNEGEATVAVSADGSGRRTDRRRQQKTRYGHREGKRDHEQQAYLKLSAKLLLSYSDSCLI